MTHTKGAMPPKVDLRDYKYTPIAGAAEDNIPEIFVLPTCDIKDQGAVNSCVAHVAAEIEEYFNYTEAHLKIPLSPGYIYGCRYNYKGEGMYLRDALKTLSKQGICYQEEFPYNEEVPTIIDKFNAVSEWKTDKYHKISSYFSIEKNDATAIKRALLAHGPVMVSIKWYDDIRVNNEGIITTSQTGSYGYHCVMVYGYTPQGWLIQNSWSKNWGNDGQAIYPYDYGFAEVWGVTDIDTDHPDISEKKLSPMVDLILKLLSALINLLKKT